MRYRPEIDGLRAVAVIPVILYHAGFQIFSGGFVGVDIFFVISGYLITTIILAEINADNFNILNFYERRARRILPALFTVMLVTVLFAWKNFLPGEMKVLGQGITASAAFMANIFFYFKNNDYFGLQSDNNPILHLWSLAVEEQFYLIFPLIMLLTWKKSKTWSLYLVLLLTFTSLLAAHLLSVKNPTAAFYLLLTRAWELLTGSLIALAPYWSNCITKNHRLNEAFSALGLIFIAYAILNFDKHTPSPSLWTLFPVIGAALVIAFSTDKTVSTRLLGSRPFVAIGLISYSLYLWHQPLFAFYRAFSYQPTSPLIFAVLCLVSVALAYLTWRFIEQPFRVKGRISRSQIFSFSCVGIAAFVLFGVIGHFNSGYPDRDPLYSRLASNYGLSLNCNGNYLINETCANTEQPQVAILGNSYAMHLVEGFHVAYPDLGFVQLTQDSCALHSNDKRSEAGEMNCPEFFHSAMSTITNTSSINTVLVSSPFQDIIKKDNLVAFENTIKTLKASKKHIVIIGPTPTTGNDFGKCFVRNKHSNSFMACDFTRDEIEKSHFEIIKRLNQLSIAYAVQFIDLTDMICDENLCHASINGTVIYRDSGHLSREGSRFIFSKIMSNERIDTF